MRTKRRRPGGGRSAPSENRRKTSEMYFHKQRLVSRKSYERARLHYPDMPPADASTKDTGSELLKSARERPKLKPAPDATKARQLDEFCMELTRTGRRANAVKWIQSKKHTLGEMTWATSRRVVEKLVKLGAVAIHACELDSYDDDQENTGHLVVKLPAARSARTALLKEIDRLARKQGYEGDLDHGQKYAYVKLD